MTNHLEDLVDLRPYIREQWLIIFILVFLGCTIADGGVEKFVGILFTYKLYLYNFPLKLVFLNAVYSVIPVPRVCACFNICIFVCLRYFSINV